jgi:7-cyano-7-deazaguanine synthase
MMIECPFEKVAVLFSGGLDSAVLLGNLVNQGKTVFPLYLRAGLRWEKVELHWLKRFLKAVHQPNLQPLLVLDLWVQDVYGTHWSLGRNKVPGYESPDEEVYLPGRNLLLFSKTSLFCAVNKIPCLAIGLLKGNPFPDSTPQFMQAFEKAASLALEYSLKIWSPFRFLEKKDVIRLGRRLPLELTLSCIDPTPKRHCGNCNKCAERQKAFAMANVSDRTQYKIPRAISLPLA